MELHKSKPFGWALLTLFALISLYALGVRTLVPPDEGRYAEMAREMLVSGDWITTRLNGIKYFEKPPLQTWMNALSFAAFGLGEWQARLWTGVCGLLGVCMTAHAGNKVFGRRAGFYAALVLGSSFFWAASSQIDSLDMSLSAMMTIALCALLIAQRDQATPAERRNWMLVCWAGMALAVLAKGLIGLVLPGGVLVVYTLAARDWRIWVRLHTGKGLLVFFAIAAPWFVLVALKNPEQPHFFFIHEHFERFLLKTHKREGAWYYFFNMLIPGIVPWLVLLPHSLAKALPRDQSAFQPRLMLLIWSTFIFIFFSYSSSKLPGYILPIFPALALLLALHLETATRRSMMAAAALITVIGIVGAALVPQMPKLASHPGEIGLLQAYQPWALAAGLTAFIGGALSLLYASRVRRDLMVLTLAGAGFCATHMLLAGFESYGYHRAGLALVPKIEAELLPDTKIYSAGIYEQSLTFYLRRTVTLVDYRDEFSFGLEQQPELGIPTVDAFVALWRRDANNGVRSVAIISEKIYRDLQQRGVPLRLVAQDTRRIVVTNI
ncbi:MAG: 4-amino-4-deoxy-L-arabinose transferase-like glycosyltransferase [Janthinobacterium sp.]|jgi:4-amino-4-deoxy-L-arabinose transferase-like glycosyltransferase